MLKKCYLICFSYLIFPIVTFAGQTFPTYHPIYSIINELQSRSILLDLSQMAYPYDIDQIEKSLRKINDGTPLTKIEQQLVNLVWLNVGGEASEGKRKVIKNPIMSYFNLRSDALVHQHSATQSRSILRGGIGVPINSHLFAYTGIVLNQYDYNDPSYKGYKWRGFAGYTEQAYINTTWENVQIKLGRDFLRWGVGTSGTLMFSDVARPMDHVLATVNYKPFRFSFITAELDEYKPALVDNVRIPVKRYLTGHRLDISLWHGRFQAGVAEVLVYGGPGETFKLAYLNPVMIYKGAHKNGTSFYGNILPMIDLLVYPLPTWRLYSSLLIDDIQVEKTGPGDLEPNELGWIIGSSYADPFRIDGLTLSTEYVRITNRTYKTPYPLETFIHRGVPLGYPLGNDCDYFQIGASYWVTPTWWLLVDYTQIRRGEGSLFTPWDEPWMNYTVAQGYSEPFFTGVVETQRSLSLKARWFANRHVYVWTDITMTAVTNEDHQRGHQHSFWQGRLRVELDWRLVFGM